MGLLARALPWLRNQTGRPAAMPQMTGGSPQGYLNYSRAYQRNEIVFAAIEMLATSAGEPEIIGRRWQRNSPQIRNEMRRLQACGISLREINQRMISNGFFQPLPNHPLVKLLNNPNPFMSRGQLWGTVVMDRCLAGNAFLLKSRYTDGPMQGLVGELWRLRPDRVRVIPDAAKFIGGYEYNTGRERTVFPAEDIIHFKTRNPLNDYYGMPPLMPITRRIDIDDYMKNFLADFYERGGASGPGSILTTKGKMADAAKDEIRAKFRHQFGKPGELMILDNAESTYTQTGLNRGLRDALPKELDAMQEARIAMVFGIPGSILGLLIGYESSSYANKRQDWQVFWDLTMTPLLSDFDDVLNLSLVPDFGQIDEVLFDFSDIRALQEDVDKLQDRARKNFQVGGWSFEEFREATGMDPSPSEGTFFVPSNMTPTPIESIDEPPVPVAPPPAQLPAPEPNMLAEVRHRCGQKIAVDVVGDPELYCWKCREAFRPSDEAPRVVVKTVERDREGRVARVLEVTA